MRLFGRTVGTLNMLALCASSSTMAEEPITFASGAPLDNYQARVIQPILAEAFNQQSIEFNAVYLPSLRALQISNSGMLDGELHRVDDFHEVTDNKYNKLIRIDFKMLSVYLALFAKEELIINNWDDLNHYTIAYYRGRKNVDAYLNNVETQHNTYKVNTDEQAFQMLAKGKVDIVISESYLGTSIVNSHSQFNGILEIKRLERTDIYSYINKKHLSLLPALLNSLQHMQSQGRVEQIVQEAKQELYQ